MSIHGLVGCCLAALLILPALFNIIIRCPLKRLPGRWHSRLSSLGYQIAALSGRGAKYVDELHHVYGTDPTPMTMAPRD